MSSFAINENSSLLGNEENEDISPKDEIKEIAPPGMHNIRKEITFQTITHNQWYSRQHEVGTLGKTNL